MKSDATRKLLISLAVSFVATLGARSNPLDNWHWRAPASQGETLNGVVFGGGLFVAVGDAGTVLASPDGRTWTRCDAGVTNSLRAVTYGDGLFVAVGGEGTILTSPNGLDWGRQASGGTGFPLTVTHANGLFVAPGGWAVLTSADGTNWTAQSTGFQGAVFGVTYGAGLFVAVGYWAPGHYWVPLTSTNGIDWSYEFRPTPEWLGEVRSIAYGDGHFVAVEQHWRPSTNPLTVVVWTSINGLDWTKSVVPFPVYTGELTAVTFGGGAFVAVGSAGSMLVATSSALQWTPVNPAWLTGGALRGVAYGNSTYVAVGDYGFIMVSTNAFGWAFSDYGFPGCVGSVAHGHGILAAVTERSCVLTSTNGVAWSQHDIGSNYLLDVTFGSEKFVAVGYYGTVMTSSDGTDWILQSSGVSDELTAVTYGDGKFVTVGYEMDAVSDVPESAATLVSTDGVTWASVSSPAAYLCDVTFGRGRFVAVGSEIVISADGTNWETCYRDHGRWISAVTEGRGIFVAVGEAGRIYSSTDARSWTLRQTAAWDLGSVAYVSGMFAAVGSSGQLLTSTDGANWTLRDLGMGLTLSHASGFRDTFLLTGFPGVILQSDPVSTIKLRLQPAAELILFGLEGGAYRLECADDLETSPAWRTLTTLTLTNTQAVWTDPQPISPSTRFYRAVRLP